MVDGLKRTYLMHIPPDRDQSKPLPLVIVLHGGGGSGAGMVESTQGGFNVLADEEGFVVAYPDAVKNHWNDGRSKEEVDYRAHRENIDDVGFISALIDQLVTLSFEKARHNPLIAMTGAGSSIRINITAVSPIMVTSLVAFVIIEAYAVAYHRGCYETIGKTYEGLTNYCSRRHLCMGEYSYEESLLDNIALQNENDYITQITIEVAPSR